MKRLTGGELHLLTEAWRAWAEEAPSATRRRSRDRLHLVFLLVRHGALRLSEALRVNDLKDFDYSTTTIRIRGPRGREVQISEGAMAAVRGLINSPGMAGLRGSIADLDQGYVRRRFYDVARSCGLDPGAGGPEVVRQSRAAELLQANVPLAIVQKFLGQRSPVQAAGFVDFTDDEARRIVHSHFRQEALRRSSARNAFTGTVTGLTVGDVTALVETTTLGGAKVHAMVTVESVQRLGVRLGQVLVVTVKAPLVDVARPAPGGDRTNRFLGRVAGIGRGEAEGSATVDVGEGMTLCSVLPADEMDELGLRVGDEAEVSFSPFGAVLALPED